MAGRAQMIDRKRYKNRCPPFELEGEELEEWESNRQAILQNTLIRNIVVGVFYSFTAFAVILTIIGFIGYVILPVM